MKQLQKYTGHYYYFIEEIYNTEGKIGYIYLMIYLIFIGFLLRITPHFYNF